MRRFVAATVEDVKHVPEDGEDHQVRGQAVEIPQKYAVRNDKLEVLHVAVGVWRRRMVIKHQQDSGDEQNDEEDERNRPEIIGSAHAERLFANFDRHPVEEQVPENRQAARAVGIGRAAAEEDRKSTRLNSSHGYISYAVFCL